MKKSPRLSREDSLRLLYDDMAMGYAKKTLWILAAVGSDDNAPFQCKDHGRTCLSLFTSAGAATAFAAQQPNVEPRALASNQALLPHLDNADRVVLDPGANAPWTMPPGFALSLKAEINEQNG